MNKKSAGILLYKLVDNGMQVFLVHPGGPFWKNKDAGAWSIPKGEFTDDEKPLDAALREFKEETNMDVAGDAIELSPVQLKSGKIVYSWAIEGDVDVSQVTCNSFVDIEWPPRSGKKLSIPEIDKGEWFTVDETKQKINPAQVALIDELMEKIRG